MSKETMPEWVTVMLQGVDDHLKCKHIGFMEPYHYSLDESEYDLPLLEMAPFKIKYGPTDDDLSYEPIETFDLLGIQEVFEELESMAFEVEHDGRSCFTLEGKIRGVQILVRIYTEPFEDTKPAIFDHGRLHPPESD